MSTISVSNITTANGSENLVLGTGNTSGNKIIVNAAGGVSVNGDVGIGVSTPSYKLDVVGAGDTTAAIRSTTSGAGLLRLVAPNTALAAFNQVQSLSGGTVNWSLGGDGNENTLVIKTNATEQIRVIANGNVGIGNTAPAYKLRVQGDISLSGGLHANGSFGTAGQILTSSATGNTYWSTLSSGGFDVRETTYTSTGTSTHTKIANLIFMIVHCVGAGGGGGGSNSAATSTGAKGGWGGGGGGYTMKYLSNAQVGTTSNVVVGSGGSGGANATVSTGGTGGNSSFANSSNGLILGRGGSGGSNTSAGAGGPSSTSGDVSIQGADGHAGVGMSSTTTVGIGGAGGDSGGGFGMGGSQVTGAATGLAGDLYGGGGGGSSSSNSGTTSRAGGAGGNGLVWVVEYYKT